jgi:WD40 repeat protein
MFSDPSNRQDRFRLTAVVTIGALLFAAVGLTVANTLQGPRLLDAQINPGGAVEGAGERLVLRVDQTVAELTTDQVTVTPRVPLEPTSDGAALILRFADSLSYATTYVIVAKVESATTGASSTLRYSFRTPDGAFYILQRAASNADTDVPDQIVHHVIGSTEQQRVVRRQPHIEQYAVADPVIGVVTSDADGAGTLTVGPLDGSKPPQTLADNSDISQLKSSGPSGLIGFVLTPLSGPDRGGDGQLHLYNPVTGKLIKVSGFDGKPFQPLDWAFVPGTTSIVAQTADNSLYLIDPLNGRPTQPLGGHSRMYGFVPGSTTLIVDDNGDYKAIDLATGNTSTLAIELPDSAGLQQLLPLGGDRGYVGWVATQDGAGLVVVINNGNVRQIYAEDPDPTGGIQSICLSPNGQYLAVAKLPRDVATNPDSSAFANKTELVDTATGRTDHEVAGSEVNWCNQNATS